MANQRVFLPMLLLVACLTSTQMVAAATAQDCAAMRRHGMPALAQACYEALAQSPDAYLRAEGEWGLDRYERANTDFRSAVAAADRNAHYRVRWGMLLHERFNDSAAAQLYAEALQRDPNDAEAYLALAQLSAGGFDDKALEYVHKALQLEPDLVAAHELLANVALEDADAALAEAQAQTAIHLAPDALDAMAVEAAAAVLADHSPEAWLQKIAQVNPAYGPGYALVAHHLELNRRYEEAATYYRKAIAVDPKLWSARSQLAIDLMRLGERQEPQLLLRACYEAGYRNAATVNSLRLLDSYRRFVTIKGPSSILLLSQSEAELLRIYYEPLLERAMASFETKYRMKLDRPVQVEVYPDHEDFAVRTLGLPGLGALGVTFGTVVAMDSPSARKPGSFRWASTLWHEMNHVYVLTATHHRVPRWFAEGLAVHEQGLADPAWAEHLTPEIVAALAQKKLLPVAQLDGGFVRPAYPQQVIVSYYQAGRICDYIEERWGANSLVDMMQAYARAQPTADVIQQTLGMSAAGFDAQFQAWLYHDVGSIVDGLDAWRQQLKQVLQLVEAHQFDQALRQAETVRALYPRYVEDDNVYGLLSQIYQARGDKAAAIGALLDYRRYGGEDPTLLEQLGTLQEQSGDLAAAAVSLNAINEIYPVNNEALHAHLGQLWLDQQHAADAIREYAALLALHPLDRPGAFYHLAEAYFADKQPKGAEENVLRALELAPGYRPAQQLLLRIEDAQSRPTQ
jgi:tetratricopeptide (TPR) repeat protein